MTQAETLIALADRVEAAEAGEQHAIVVKALEALCIAKAITYGQQATMLRYLSAHAFLDAAVSLVPEGWAWMAGCAPGDGFFATLAPTDESGIEADDVDTNAATAALALTAAAIRARAASLGEG